MNDFHWIAPRLIQSISCNVKLNLSPFAIFFYVKLPKYDNFYFMFFSPETYRKLSKKKCNKIPGQFYFWSAIFFLQFFWQYYNFKFLYWCPYLHKLRNLLAFICRFLIKTINLTVININIYGAKMLSSSFLIKKIILLFF